MSGEQNSSVFSAASGASGEALRAGRYVVTGTLGVGAQGETLDAVDKREGRPVAIKRFSLRHAQSWKGVELAEREASVLAALSHPSLPRYVEHFEEDGALYLVMEKIEGESLAARRKRGQALSHEQVVRFLTDAAACLRYLHGHAPPIVHRDIKPGNVILRPDGSYCLVDFGSVRDRLKPEGGSTVVGTFGYMAPEQFQGRAAPVSDVYAVAATALSLLTGREPEDLPHQGLAIDVEGALRGQADRRLIAALRSMLEPDPDRRAPSVDAALKRSGLLEAPPSRARVENRAERAPRDDARPRHQAQAEEHLRRTYERQRQQQERHYERQARHHAEQAERDARHRAAQEERDARYRAAQEERGARHRAEREERRHRKAARKEARRAERDARRYASSGWRRPHRPVPPGIVLGVIVLVALRVASVATFALFGVLLPLLFTLLGLTERRERMREIGRAGQRGLTRARQHIRHQFLGGPLPAELERFVNAVDTDELPRVDEPPPRPRARVSVDVEAEELPEEEAPTPEAERDARRR